MVFFCRGCSDEYPGLHVDPSTSSNNITYILSLDFIKFNALKNMLHNK